MVNKAVLKKKAKSADAVNEAGGPAYRLEPKEALAQLVLTGCLNGTFYMSADSQLDELKRYCELNSPEYIAKLAVYGRLHGYMKDTPAFLLAVLHNHGSNKLLKAVFPLVINNGKMLRNFVQIVRSGTLGRKSFGTATKRLIRNWLESRTDKQLFFDSVGTSPSLADIIKMVHPRPLTPDREALYGYLIGKDVKELPDIVADWERFKNGVTDELPHVPFQMLTSLQGDDKRAREIWSFICKTSAWTMTRMNLNNFEKYGVFDKGGMVKMVADRLADPQRIREANPFPYQLLMTYLAYNGTHRSIKDALHDAMEVAVENVPALDGKVLIAVDTSGSMQSPVTGHRKGATTNVTCVQVAALIAAAIMRKNRDAEVVLFDTTTHQVNVEPRDTVMTNAQKMNRHGGGTDCSTPFRYWNKNKAKADAVVMVSDNESWFSISDRYGGVRGTDVMREWLEFKERNRKARLVCIDLTPNTTTQANTQPDVLNVGGFGDQVFNVMADFLNGKVDSLVKRVEELDLKEKVEVGEPEQAEEQEG